MNSIARGLSAWQMDPSPLLCQLLSLFIKRQGGEEFIWIMKFLEQKITDVLCGIYGLFYLILMPFLFTVRAFLWPIRRKAPWAS